MDAHHKSRVFLSAGFLTLSVLVLGGCESAMNPSPMPTGYTYHREPYKSAPGPEIYNLHNGQAQQADAATNANSQASVPQPFGGTYKEGLKTSYYDPAKPSRNAGQ